MPCVCIRSLAHSWLPLVARNVQNFGFETQSIIFLCKPLNRAVQKKSLSVFLFLSNFGRQYQNVFS